MSWRRFSEIAPRECSRGVADGGIDFRSIERDGKRDNFGVGVCFVAINPTRLLCLGFSRASSVCYVPDSPI